MSPGQGWHAGGVAGALLRLGGLVLVTGLLTLAGESVAIAAGPSERVADLVSNTDTNGVDVQTDLKVSPDGTALAWISLGGYADVHSMNAELPYVARRASDGTWSTSAALSPTLDRYFRPGILNQLGGYAFSADLRSMSFITQASIDPEDLDLYVSPFGTIGALDVYRVDGSGQATWISRPPSGPAPNELFNDAKQSGVSADGSSVFFESSEPLVGEVVSGAGVSHLYRWRNGTVELVGRDAGGQLLAGGSRLADGGTGSVAPTSGNAGDLPDSDAVSSDGRAFAYSGVQTGASQVFLHTKDGTVRRLSSSQKTGSVGDPATSDATFVAAVGDLSIIYFRSLDQLSDDAPANGGDYRYDVASGELSFSNPDDRIAYNPFAPGGFVRASEDGRYVYFASRDALTTEAVAGELNLYVRTPEGYRFISPITLNDGSMTIFPGPGLASAQSFTSTNLSADGTKFVYQTDARATGYDSNATTQVYLYDVQTNSVSCISCNRRADRSTGNARILSSSEIIRATPRVISDDGSRIVFATEEALVPEDTNGVLDVYERVGDQLSLLSGGMSRAPSSLVGMSPDGGHVYILTRAKLVDEDDDAGLQDIYDLRIGSARPKAPVIVQCAGDDCQGALPTSSPAPTPVSSAPRGAAPVGSTDSRYALASISRTAAAKAAKTGKLTLSVRVGTAGRVAAQARARIKGLDARVAAASASAKQAATVRMSLKLSAAARRQLQAKHTLTLQISVSFSAAARSVSRAVTLTAPTARKPR